MVHWGPTNPRLRATMRHRPVRDSGEIRTKVRERMRMREQGENTDKSCIIQYADYRVHQRKRHSGNASIAD